MTNNELIKQIKEKVKSGEISTFIQKQEELDCSRTFLEWEVNRGVYEKIQIGKVYLLIKK